MSTRKPLPLPELHRREGEGVTVWTDPGLAKRGVVVGFTERTGGVSDSPYDSLNLAGHVGDDPAAVRANRARLLSSLNLGSDVPIHVPQQVHGVDILAVPGAPEDVLVGDGLITVEPNRLLLLCFADCVPIVLVAPDGELAVLHAGWRGVIGRIAGEGVRRLTAAGSCDPPEINVYIGAHIHAGSYPVGPDLAARFIEAFGDGVIVDTGDGPRLDLDAAVGADLRDAGVDPLRIARLGVDTATHADRFFSYRHSGGTTGRHGAFAVRIGEPTFP